MPLFITNIQRCSFHDGPGIRTTVFLKGCSLRCFWCHNPETLHSGYGLRYISSRCIQCEACVEACRQASGLDCRSPWQLVEYAKTQDGCSGCGQCVSCCPSQALVSTAKAYEREELLPLLLPGGKLLIGDVAFASRAQLEECRAQAGDDWDGDEFYFVYEELRAFFPAMTFEPCSHCAGVLALSARN